MMETIENVEENMNEWAFITKKENTTFRKQFKTSQELRKAALTVVGCQGVKVFLLKDVIITTSVTTVLHIKKVKSKKNFSHKKI